MPDQCLSHAGSTPVTRRTNEGESYSEQSALRDYFFDDQYQKAGHARIDLSKTIAKPAWSSNGRSLRDDKKNGNDKCKCK
jgi:hypothetical protein